ncbi:MAG: family 10 glycosylhydrolase [Dysgonamonadaceae bacterium]|nr:family 10 glycosylhydrolase [Dysgonamonadaceae bacterium]
MKRLLIFIFSFVIAFVSLAQPIREVRAVWLTVNYGLDWPRQAFYDRYDIDNQKVDLDRILDRLKEANINMVFFQARLRGAAAYNSRIEQMSEYVSRRGSKAAYDPLAYAVEACHRRGMECHAWFVVYPLGKANSPNISAKMVKTFKRERYLDPGNPETADYLMRLIREIVSNYDIDGLHFDYIRYPDNSAKFPDDDTWKRYGRGMSKGDWRRENINKFVYRAYDLIKSIKPYVQVSSSVVGQYTYLPDVARRHWTAYYSVYQDPVDWLSKGKQDFIVPMLYNSDNLFFPFVDDWLAQSGGRYIVPGLAAYLVGSREARWQPAVILEQIRYSREKNAAGNAFFRTQNFLDNYRGMLDDIKRQYYSCPALLPALTWLNKTIPDAPQGLTAESKTENILHLEWEPSPSRNQGEDIFYNLYRSATFPVDVNNPENLLAVRISGTMSDLKTAPSETAYYYAVTAYDRYHNESRPSFPAYFVNWRLKK